MQHIPLDTKRTRPYLRAIQASLLSLLCLALSAAQAGTITTVAGRGLGDGGPAVAASLAKPTGVAVDAAGNVYIADPNDLLIRKIDTSGNISSIATTYASTIALDPTGNLYVAQYSSLAKLGPNGNLNVVAGTPDGIASTFFGIPVGDGHAAAAAQLCNPDSAKPSLKPAQSLPGMSSPRHYPGPAPKG